MLNHGGFEKNSKQIQKQCRKEITSLYLAHKGGKKVAFNK